MNLLFFGCGYVAQRLAGLALDKGAIVKGTTRSKINFKALNEQSIHPLLYRGGKPLGPEILKDVTHILVSIPPFQNGDYVINDHWEIFKQNSQLQWIGYLSSTGVYGNHYGEWVNEESSCLTTQTQSLRRLKAEAQWLNLLKSYHNPVHIFRLSGIYGPERNVFNQIKEGTAQSIRRAEHFFSRIHIDDIVQTLWASIKNASPGEIYNLADDKPTSAKEVVDYGYRLQGIKLPVPIAFEEADLSSRMQAFYAENKKVSNSKIKDKLQIKLLYPTYREGLKSLFAALKSEENKT